jgi:hypothetical protein
VSLSICVFLADLLFFLVELTSLSLSVCFSLFLCVRVCVSLYVCVFLSLFVCRLNVSFLICLIFVRSFWSILSCLFVPMSLCVCLSLCVCPCVFFNFFWASQLACWLQFLFVSVAVFFWFSLCVCVRAPAHDWAFFPLHLIFCILCFFGSMCLFFICMRFVRSFLSILSPRGPCVSLSLCVCLCVWFYLLCSILIWCLYS